MRAHAVLTKNVFGSTRTGTMRLCCAAPVESTLSSAVGNQLNHPFFFRMPLSSAMDADTIVPIGTTALPL